MRKMLIVARHEFTTNVRRWEFLLVTLGLPLATVLLILLASVPNLLYLQARIKAPDAVTVGVVDPPPGMSFPESAEQFHFRPFGTKDEAIAALVGGQVGWVYVFAPDYLRSGRAEVYKRKKSPFDVARPPNMPSMLRDYLLRGKVDDAVRERVRDPLRETDIVLDAEGRRIENPLMEQVTSLALPYSMMMLLMMALLGSSTYILRSLVEERESRVLEMLLSSVRASDLFFGKILGLGMLGLLQVGVWLTLASPVVASFVAALPLSAGKLGLFLVYFVMGYALYAAIIAGIGAVGTSEKESNQIFAVFVLIFSSPMLFLPILLDAPNGMLQRFFSIFPLTSPLMMVMRSVNGQVTWVDLAASLVLLALSVWAAMTLSLKVFQMGMHLYGKTATPREVWRAMRGRTP